MKKLLKGVGLVFIGLLVIGVLFGEAEPAEPEIIEYQQTSIATMHKELTENAMKAEQNYNDKYVEITGYVVSIDSDGEYFSITHTNEWYDFESVLCNFSTEEQKEKFVNNYKTGSKITVKGKITDVGEILGYSLKIKEI